MAMSYRTKPVLLAAIPQLSADAKKPKMLKLVQPVATVQTTQKSSSAAAIPSKQPPSAVRFCSCCGRRHFIEAATTAFLQISPPKSNASALHSDDYLALLNKIHPPRPDWYEEFYASVMNTSMKSYEAKIAGYKLQLFGKIKGKAKRVMEIGIGTGPNLEYYAGNDEVQVFGLDPNKKMEKYARASATAVGIPLKNFHFIEAVAEAVPLDDSSIDAVVGTLVLCSVKDVNMALKEVKRVLKPGGLFLFIEHVAAKDGTSLKFWQTALDPLQQTVSDGCHLTRETGKYITSAGFSSLELNMASWIMIPSL
ncbi:S-adenosyl-L-methionine-dependent methyltransferases superfamily protein isoform 2 [Hibiscus syriacus]|uniref:S-adenosyl-L-methionine-dependent methyltransferases superfamily protein isoform 2 n=1 Tax=Hibiscus syriacus TaxID=106335 RepID=A0A6A3CC24_HIBSY|nr:S-adenosyl-L-methionine-dependent methyltransferases superfamily protein isoform 2 [Hibiscus syriacus]